VSLVGAEVVDLRVHRQFRDTVADRIWRAWWEPAGHSLAEVEAALDEVTSHSRFPFTFVAQVEGRFIGTVTGIQSDITARPTLGPCIAALWVEPEMRGHGMGAFLVSAALQRLQSAGHTEAYVAARQHLYEFYADRGWTPMERLVGEDQLDIFARALP
jgi:predicted N-acetyltransferase YhbS